jgi:hypothetical protein
LLALPALRQFASAGYDRVDEEGSQKDTEKGFDVHDCGFGFAKSVFVCVVQREMLAQLRIMSSLWPTAPFISAGHGVRWCGGEIEL